MAVDTKIEWCDHTINFWWGCEKVSPACANCYAEGFAKRTGDDIWGHNKPRRFIKSAVSEALKLNEKAKKEGVRYRVFTNSMADFFETDHGQPIVDHEGCTLWNCAECGRDMLGAIPSKQTFGPYCCGQESQPVSLSDLRSTAFDTIDRTPHLDWLILTKRTENIHKMWPDLKRCDSSLVCKRGDGIVCPDDECDRESGLIQRRRNVWIGTTVKNQEQAEKRIPELLKCRDLSPVLFLSCEPLIGSLNLNVINTGDFKSYDCLNGVESIAGQHGFSGQERFEKPHIDWVISGTESGHGRRPAREEWISGLLEQCAEADVAFFNKQMEIYGKVEKEISAFPEHLQVRQYPKSVSGK